MTKSVEKIIARAADLGIALWAEGEQLRVRGSGEIPPKLVAVLKDNKPALLAYLKKEGLTAAPATLHVSLPGAEEHVDRSPYSCDSQSIPDEVLTQIRETVQLCCTCLDQIPPIETQAFAEYDGTMYCALHLPTRVLTQAEIAARFESALSGWQVTIEPCSTLRQQHFERERDKWRGASGIPEAVWYQIPRAPIWQKIVDEAITRGDAFTGLEYDWASCASVREEFDPSKPVDWARYGYEQRGKDGRLHLNSSPYWELTGYKRAKDGRWYSQEET